MRHIILVFTATLVVVLAATAALGATSDPYVYEDNSTMHQVVIVGATLGENWAGFPTYFAPDYTVSGQQLDVTLPLYVTWILDTNYSQTPVAVDPPQPITDFESSWFHYDEFQVINIDQAGMEGAYTTCAAYDGLEEPTLNSFPLTSDGELRVNDIHGGIGTTTMIHLQACTSHLGSPCGYNLNILVGWAPPATRFDDNLESSGNRAPGTTWTRAIDHGGWPGFVDMRTVEWVSADVGYASRRVVDASDLAAIAAYYPSAVRWGFESGESPNNSPNFHVDLAPGNGYIDASDLAGWSNDSAKSCGLSKVTEGEDSAAILAWFGFSPTGRTISAGPSGETGPEYELVDPEQKAIAIGNPYGYRNPKPLATSMSWGQVRILYR